MPVISRTLFTFVLVLLGAGTFVGVPSSAAAAPRALTVTPPTGLVNQVVQVQWAGFNPSFTVTIVQCKAAPVSKTDCFVNTNDPSLPLNIRPPAGNDPNGSGIGDAVTLPDGTGSASIEVRPALDLPALGCSAGHPCTVLAFENDGQPFPANGLPATAVTAPLLFAPSPTDCPRVPTPDVTTVGEESTARALYNWSGRVCTDAKPLALDYTAKGSPEGRRNYLLGNADVGLTSTAATPDEKRMATRDFAYAPIDVTGVVVAFNVTDSVTHQKIADMNLTPRLVAMLVAGQQYGGGPGTALFTDQEFVALNPGHNWPINTQPPELRSERNADAYVLTNWLQNDSAARNFLDGKEAAAPVDPFWKGIVYPTDSFESRDPNLAGKYNPRNGTIVNTRRLFNFQGPGDGSAVSSGVDGLFGVMDAVTAQSFGLPTAKLRPANAANAPFVAADTAGITAGYAAMKTNADGVTKLADPTSATGYPLVKVDYAMVPTTGVGDAAKRTHIAQFLDFASGPGQQAGALPGGYLPLTADLQGQVVKARDAMMAQNGVDPRPAPPTTTTTTTPPDQPPVNQVPPGNDGSFTSGSGLGSSGSGYGGNTGTAAAAPGAPVRSTVTTSPRRTGPSTPSTNPVSSGLRNFLSGDHQLFLPVLFVVGAVALVAGPLITWLSRRRRRKTVGPALP
jgi:ABC-type phosphate transport system substrate-binding protein